MESASIAPVISQRKLVPDAVLGIIFLLFTEVMLFAGLISAYIVNRAGAAVDWPPYNQPRLPVNVTAFNTLILLLSGLGLFLFNRRTKKNESLKGKTIFLLIGAILLGLTFLSIQGREWTKLIGYGLTTHSGIYGAFFYTIIGFHAWHVMVGLSILTFLLIKVMKASGYEQVKNSIFACSLYWYFVVGIWPLLYRLIYFN